MQTKLTEFKELQTVKTKFADITDNEMTDIVRYCLVMKYIIVKRKVDSIFQIWNPDNDKFVVLKRIKRHIWAGTESNGTFIPLECLTPIINSFNEVIFLDEVYNKILNIIDTDIKSFNTPLTKCKIAYLV